MAEENVDLAAKDERIKALEKEIKDLKAEVAKQTKAETPAQEPEKIEVDPKLLALACEAYGIGPEHVLDSGLGEDGAVVIVTAGGAKVRWHKGDQPERLGLVQITGVSDKPKRPPVAGKAQTKGKRA